jgi:murein DD-endopeptidase MepM/ murein hydrolase activator NlpD
MSGEHHHRRLRFLAVAIVTAATVEASAAAPMAAASGHMASSAPTPPSRAPSVSLSWPLPGRPPILRRFEPPAGPYAPGHRGVDLGAAAGTPVLAAAAGIIGFAAPLAGRGVVTVRHDGGLRTTYEPVAAIRRPGDRVARGQQIGWLAAPTGHCGAGTSCLHWGLLRGSTYLDPLSLLAASPVRLFPPAGTPSALSAVSVARWPAAAGGTRAAAFGTAKEPEPPPARTAVSERDAMAASLPQASQSTRAVSPAAVGTERPAPDGDLRSSLAVAVAMALAAATMLALLLARR